MQGATTELAQIASGPARHSSSRPASVTFGGSDNPPSPRPQTPVVARPRRRVTLRDQGAMERNGEQSCAAQALERRGCEGDGREGGGG